MPGNKLGHYETLSELGSGGMGVVYRARDTKLDRDVAIKILRDDLASDAELRSRFQREAKILASLNHPHIANIYGIEEENGVRFLVLELVDGETLAERLRRKPLTVREAVEYARQVAEALECAHERGIIHRDLKPANVKLTGDGTAKVLDFGLARSFTQLQSTAAAGDTTLTTSVAITEPHTVMGTAPYMSPEQVRGEILDTRTDVWSFGCVLYELLTNQRPIQGNTSQEVMAAVLMKDPDYSRLPKDTPEGVQCLLRRCLQKDRRCRLRHIGDARLELEEALGIRETTRPASRSEARPSRWGVAAGVAAALGLATGAFAAWRLTPSRAVDVPVMRFAMHLPTGSRIVASWNPSVALSPDGRTLFYIVPTPNSPRVFTPFLHPLDQFQAKSYDSITGGVPMFAPDSRSICFIDQVAMTLRRATIQGGAAQTLRKLEWINQGEWAEDGHIYFSPAIRSGIVRIPAEGGEDTVITKLDTASNEQTHRFAQLLPGGKSMIFTIGYTTTESYDDAAIAAYSMETKRKKILVEGGTYARYLPSGHIVYARAGNLYAFPFDAETLEVKGPPVLVLEGVLMSTNTGAAYYSISKTGTLAYAPGTAEGGKRQLVWVDRQGKEAVLPLPQRAYLYPRVSPDGKRLALEIEGPAHDFYVYEFDRGVLTRMTLDGMNHAPVWSPDGSTVAFRSWRDGGMTMWSMPADRSDKEQRLLPGKGMQSVVSWSSDGQHIAFIDMLPDTASDVFVLPLKGERKPVPLARSRFMEGSPKFSPDGKWVAYCSNESGKPEVYVQPWPGPGPKIQISTNGGTDPVWRRVPGELYYRNGDAMMAVAVRTSPTFSAGKPVVLWRGHYSHGMSSSCGAPGVTSFNYDVTADGQHFLMVKDMHQDLAADRIHVVINWTQELARTVPVK